MGTSKRQGLTNEKEVKNIPGPGNYEKAGDSSIIKRNSPNYGFGTGSRDNSIDRHATIGPGSYSAIDFIGKEGKKSTIAKRLNADFIEKESRNKPGPGAYNN